LLLCLVAVLLTLPIPFSKLDEVLVVELSRETYLPIFELVRTPLPLTYVYAFLEDTDLVAPLPMDLVLLPIFPPVRGFPLEYA